MGCHTLLIPGVATYTTLKNLVWTRRESYFAKPASRSFLLSAKTIVRRHAVDSHAHGFLEKSNIQRDLIALVECILSRDAQTNTEKAS